MHNAGYRKLGLNFVFAAFETPDAKFALKSMREFNWRGFAVTIPHKESVIKHLDTLDLLAKKIGAVNTVVNTKGKLKGYNTDVLALIKLFKTIPDISKKRTLILGAGGAARAAIAALQRNKVINITITNRTESKAKKLSKEFKIKYKPLNICKEIHEYEIIINSTPVGMTSSKQLFDFSTIQKYQTILDMVYMPQYTPLLLAAKRKGARIIFGYEMLLEQAYEQFALFTGVRAPRNIMRKELLKQIH